MRGQSTGLTVAASICLLLETTTRSTWAFFTIAVPPHHQHRKQKRGSSSLLRVALGAEEADICVIGGGVSGLTAAWTAAQEAPTNTKVVLVEASQSVGGRVASDCTDTGFTLDRGFAVFIEEYPYAKQLLDYTALQLCKFLPGALVKIKDSDSLQRVADPLRQPEDIFTALLAAVGSLEDKIRVLPLIYNVRSKSIEELFEEPETDTLTALKERWGFSSDMIDKFFSPFLEGIYLAPLSEQSSRMFSFVFKMFSEGAASLPAGGIGAVSKQLADKATAAGVDIRTDLAINRLMPKNDRFLLKTSKGKDIRADKVILATEGPITKELLSTLDSMKGLADLPDQVQRFVGCLYYSFDGAEPVQDPILILNGADRDGEKHPVNNICFPSVVSKSYAPAGKGLCSVTVLKQAMDFFKDRDEELDAAVRKQISSWFPECKDAILNTWKLERIYRIPKAQPAQFGGPFPANVHEGRLSDTYYGIALPKGLYICGDHMATATLNGALESGVKAGMAAAEALARD